MASLDDILTTQKNGVVAINSLTTALAAFKTIYESFVGNATLLGASTATLVSQGSGRLVNFTVTVAGSGVGAIYDSATVTDAVAANVLCTTPTALGIVQVNIPFSSGLVIKPGTGQTINVTYS